MPEIVSWMYMVVTVLVLIRGHVSFVFLLAKLMQQFAFHCPWLPHPPHFWPLSFRSCGG